MWGMESPGLSGVVDTMCAEHHRIPETSIIVFANGGLRLINLCWVKSGSEADKITIHYVISEKLLWA